MQDDSPNDPRPAPPAPGSAAQRDTGEASEWEASQRKSRNSLLIRVLAGVVILVLFIVFVTLNSDAVRVDFIFVETRTPLVWVFLVCALIGALVTFLLGRPARRANRKYIKELERRLEEKGRR